METNLQQLKNAIQKACPELMEVNFGCEIKIDSEREEKGQIAKIIDFKIDKGHPKLDPVVMVSAFISRDFKDLVFYGYEFEILGSPITLSHVLRAIGKTKRGSNGISIDALGYIREKGVGFNDSSYWCNWNLEKDTLDEQSPQTIEWLNGIISSKEQ